MKICGSPIPMMSALARMAGIDAAPIRRMVLVLDVKATPVLYVESFLTDSGELPDTELMVEQKAVRVELSDKPIVVEVAK